MAIKVSRIEKEFILKTLMDGKMPVEVVVAGTKISAILSTIHPEELTFSLVAEAPSSSQKRADLFIMFKGTRVTCTLAIKSLKKDRLVSEMPEGLYRDLSRGLERIQPEAAINVSIFTEGSQFKLNFPASEEFYDPEPPSLNIKFDAERITNLLKAFREKALSFSSENKIVMFRDRRPTSVAEELMAWSGKTLLLPMSDAVELLRPKDGKVQKVLSQEDITRVMRSSGRDPLQLSHDLNHHVEGFVQKKIWHELYSPVLYREYVVGYIYLLRSDMQTNPFSAHTLEFVQQFSRLLSYSLMQNGYFQSIPVRESFNKSELVDISGSGLLFSMPFNGPALSIYTDVDLQIQLAKRSLMVRGRIMRRFQDSGRIYIGIKFLELSMEDMDFLMTYLYGENPEGEFADDPIIS